jgi:hypothetical protein
MTYSMSVIPKIEYAWTKEKSLLKVGIDFNHSYSFFQSSLSSLNLSNPISAPSHFSTSAKTDSLILKTLTFFLALAATRSALSNALAGELHAMQTTAFEV